MPDACPTPHKIPWQTRSEAVQAMKRGGGKRVYHCRAGHWHTTSVSRVAKSRRVQLAKPKPSP